MIEVESAKVVLVRFALAAVLRHDHPGHTLEHLTGARNYKSVTLVHDSAWQAQTEYQKMMNLVPDPARVPVVDLKSREVSLVQF